MKTYTILFILLFFASQSQAQVPGYKSKRFFVEIGTTFMPNIPFSYTLPFSLLLAPNNKVAISPWTIRTPTAQNKGIRTFPKFEDTDDYVIAAHFNLSANYVLSRKNILKLEYSHSTAGAVTYTSDKNYRYGFHYIFYQLNINDINISISFNKFGKKGKVGIAPLGGYWDIGLRFVAVNGLLKDYQSVRAGSFSSISEFEQYTGIDPNSLLIGPTLRFGYRAIIKDKIILNIGGELTFFLNYIAFQSSDKSFYYQKEAANYQYQYQVIRSVGERYSLGIHVGLGYLLF